LANKSPEEVKQDVDMATKVTAPIPYVGGLAAMINAIVNPSIDNALYAAGTAILPGVMRYMVGPNPVSYVFGAPLRTAEQAEEI